MAEVANGASAERQWRFDHVPVEKCVKVRAASERQKSDADERPLRRPKHGWRDRSLGLGHDRFPTCQPHGQGLTWPQSPTGRQPKGNGDPVSKYARYFAIDSCRQRGDSRKALET